MGIEIQKIYKKVGGSDYQKKVVITQEGSSSYRISWEKLLHTNGKVTARHNLLLHRNIQKLLHPKWKVTAPFTEKLLHHP